MSNQNGNLEFRFNDYNCRGFQSCLKAFLDVVFPGLDFSAWNALGYQFTEYTPFSFLENGHIVSNVSASPMNLFVSGKEKRAVQIGTVATLPEYRNRGLARELLKKSMEYWEPQCEFFFLFANPDSAEFYRRLGFHRVGEKTFRAAAPKFSSPPAPARKLDLGDPKNRDLLFRLGQNRAPVSTSLGVYRQNWLLMFYAATVYPANLFFIEALGVAVIRELRRNTLHLVDVIGGRIPALTELFPFIASADVTEITFGFTPDLMGCDEIITENDEDSLLFVTDPFAIENQPFRFPATSRA